MITAHYTECSDALLEGLKRNDPRITRDFYYRLRRITFRYFATRYGVQHRETFADCFSDAFLILLRKVQLGDYRPHNLEAFAFGIVKNTFRDAVRRASRPDQPTAEEVLPESSPPPNEVYYEAADWFEALGHPQLLSWFRQLSPRDQYLLDLRLQGYNLQEIAERSDLAYGTLRNFFPKLLRQARNEVS